MIIGIDIDDTLTDIKDELYSAALNLAKKRKRTLHLEIPFVDGSNDGSRYKKVFGFTHEDLLYFIKNYQEKIMLNAKPRPFAKQTILLLKGLGHKIYIITARDYDVHDDPYSLSETWLKENEIYYDKLIVNAKNKSLVCKHENVNILIDDNINNCIRAKEEGIKPIYFSEFDDQSHITNLDDWKKIFDYIKFMTDPNLNG